MKSVYDIVIIKEKRKLNMKKPKKVLMNWKCSMMGLTIKKKITYCGEKHNSKCQNCSFKSDEFEAQFN